MPNENPQLPPPGANSGKAQNYIDTLTHLIDQDKVVVTQTDLSRFNSTSMEDHYRIDLKDYDAEISHNKNPETGEETFILIFNSIKRFDAQNPQPVILSYMRLTPEQFLKLKQSSDNQLEKARIAAEEERFTQVMAPVDDLLNQLSGGEMPKADSLSNDAAAAQVNVEEDPKAPTETPEPASEKPQDKSFDNMQSISHYTQVDDVPEDKRTEELAQVEPSQDMAMPTQSQAQNPA